jgi:soluble lytic murein transglycosylase-like protein
MDSLILGGAALVLILMARKRAAAATSTGEKADPNFDLAVRTAQDAGIDPAILLGIIKVESAWNPNATNLVGSDAARGGAFGLVQMTLRTARGFDPDVTGEQLLDPVTNLRFAGLLLAEIRQRFGADWRDVAAAWNSGKAFDYAPEVTRYKYVPKVLAAANAYATDLSLDLGEGAEPEV